ncbi:MAG: alkaline phosphatase, partial [Bacteroidales bacterium]|nr:alkaline phosphatase [Bacteroidales bacterium]
GMNYIIDKKDADFPVLIIKKGRKTLRIPSFKSVAYLNNEEFDLGSVTVYIDKNDTFYIPRNLADKLK